MINQERHDKAKKKKKKKLCGKYAVSDLAAAGHAL